MLTLENIEHTTLAPNIDPLDTLQRIATAWLAIGLPPSACDVCELRYLLDEALVLEEQT